MRDSRNVRVLIAEDDYLISRMIEEFLDEAGYTIVGRATNGLQAVEMVTQMSGTPAQPDVVLMDVKMPGIGGIEATRQIYERCPTPVVVLTAFDTPELVAEASDAGVGAYLVKPSNMRELDRAITVAMARFGDMMALRRLNEDLAAYDYVVAHDLKAPLALLLLSAELLTQDHITLSPEETRRRTYSIMRNAYKMRSIIESLLLLAEASHTEVDLRPLDMAEVVAGAQERLVWMIEEQHAEISAPPPEAWPVALGRSSWVEGVWANYLSNAIKYGGCPPRLELGGAAQSDGYVRFWVRDHGPGIAPGVQSHLFVPFTRLPDGKVRGHGLGLSIVRRIVEKMGGQVGVESDGVPGEGSTFWFTLRAARRLDPTGKLN